MSRRVFIPQEPTRRDPVSGEFVTIMNLAPAAKFGDPVVCLPPGGVALSTQPTLHRLKEKMRGFSDDDYLIAVGDPSLIAMAAAIASDYNRGQFTLLKWDRASSSYTKVHVDLHRGLRKEN